MKLHEKHCVPCEGGAKPFSADEVQAHLSQVDGWEVDGEGKRISKAFSFKDFLKAMAFVDAVADVAEMEGHHPDIHIHYNKVRLELWTHAIGGLSENDFILAAKLSAIADQPQAGIGMK